MLSSRSKSGQDTSTGYDDMPCEVDMACVQLYHSFFLLKIVWNAFRST